MFCTQCGNQINSAHKFCSGCGKKTGADSSNSSRSSDANEKSSGDATNWQSLSTAHEIFAHPLVEARIKRIAETRTSGMSDKEITQQMKLLSSVPAPEITLGVVKEIVLPFYSRIGLNKNTSVERNVPGNFADVLVAVLCSLASRSQPLRDIREAEDGCVIDAQMPQTLFSWQGDILVSIENANGSTNVVASIKLPGQAFDWGKSKRMMRDLFDDIEQYRLFEL